MSMQIAVTRQADAVDEGPLPANSYEIPGAAYRRDQRLHLRHGGARIRGSECRTAEIENRDRIA
jgi:hypothetical protein